MTKLHSLALVTVVEKDGETPPTIIRDDYKMHIDYWDPIYQPLIDQVKDASAKADLQAEYDAAKDAIEKDILKRSVSVVDP
jgi:hypothetical protein